MTDGPSSMYAVVDVSTWPVVDVEHLGGKAKDWLSATDGRPWLYKRATFNTARDGSLHRKGDDWSERIATAVADALDVPAARTELAIRSVDTGIELGIISRIVIDPGTETLVHGNELLGATAERPRLHPGYTLEAVCDELRQVAPPTGTPQWLTGWDCFVGFVIFDALIGNTDRHWLNWAAIRDDGVLRLAPSYDHASCLGFQLHDDDRRARLSTRDAGRGPDRWARRARTPFEGGPHTLQVAQRALAMTTSSVRDHWIGRCDALPEIGHLIDLVPDDRMSQPAREFAAAVYRANHRTLRDPSGTVSP